jgi:hypothetical protein
MRQTVAPHARGILSRRGCLNVARQFIAWNAPNPRPSRRERYDSVPRLCKPRRTTRRHIEPNHFISTRRTTFSDTFQAMNCLATFVWSLRDRSDLLKPRITFRPIPSSNSVAWIFPKNYLIGTRPS